ncbi:MAG: primase-helicase family protein, partial [Pseudomonadales bacterium]
VFDPSGSHPRGVYNLWQGFGVHPMSGASCALFHAHLLQVICAGCVKCYQYVLNWLALMIQQPHELPGVAIVLVSIEGTGKGLFIKYLQALMGVHFVRVSHKSELVGQFSGHLSRAVLVFADELCWRDDRDAAGVLKGLITEKTRLLNQKHIDAIPVNNCIHLIAASNESWVIPAGQTDRRFLVLDVVPCLASTILSGRRQL